MKKLLSTLGAIIFSVILTTTFAGTKGSESKCHALVGTWSGNVYQYEAAPGLAIPLIINITRISKKNQSDVYTIHGTGKFGEGEENLTIIKQVSMCQDPEGFTITLHNNMAVQIFVSRDLQQLKNGTIKIEQGSHSNIWKGLGYKPSWIFGSLSK